MGSTATVVSAREASTTLVVSATAAVTTATGPRLTVSETAVGSQPVGVVAIGHSGLTGQNSDPTHPRQDPRQNSWATGASPEVDSIYQRLVAARPETQGHVANTAEGGAVAQSLADQAQAALNVVRAPQLVIIQTVDNDIRCDGTDAAHVPEFGMSVANALDVITSASPNSKILLVSELGRPSTTFVELFAAANPGFEQSVTGPGICDFYNESGALADTNFAALTDIVDSYENEENQVCANVPQCHTDGGVRAAWIDRVDYFSSDWNHLNSRGLAAEAEQIWPTVETILRLTPG
jgi:hypothetical protein